MTHAFRPLAAAALALAGLFPWSAQANLLANGSFEQRVVTGTDTCDGTYLWCVRSSDSTPGWTQEGDGVDLIHNNYTQPPPVLLDAADGQNFLDLNQANRLGGLSQAVAVTAGASYRLTLQAAAWASNSIGGTVGFELFDPDSGAVLASGSFTDATGGTWVQQQLQAAATSGSLGVRIRGLAATQAGMGVDDVVLSAVPEPATWALALAGGALLAARRRRGGPARCA